MNKASRKTLAQQVAALEAISFEATEFENDTQRAEIKTQIDDVRRVVDGLREDEESKFENMSDNLQSGTTGQAIEAARDLLEEAVVELDSALECFEGDTNVVKDPQTIDDHVTGAIDKLNEVS